VNIRNSAGAWLLIGASFILALTALLAFGPMDSSDAQACRGGRTCPVGTVKVYMESAGGVYVLNQQRKACVCLVGAE
jgi:hypothetical protein